MFINPKIDLVFKKLFGSEENKDILLSLINAILPPTQQIKKIILKNPYNLADYIDGKLSILDIKAEDEHHVQYDIEMQIKGTDFYGKRVLYYWSKMFGSQIDAVVVKTEDDKKKKQDYTDLRKCIVISLMDFTFFEDERYCRCFSLRDRDTSESHRDLDYIDLYFVELEKFYGETGDIQNTLQRWIAFLNNAQNYTKRNLPKELAMVKEIQKATEKLNIMTLNNRERDYYEAQQRYLLDENTRHNASEAKVKAAEEKVTKAQEKVKKAEEKVKKAEENAKKAEENAKKAEQDKARAEQDKAKAEQDKAKAEQDKAKAEAKTKDADKLAKIEVAKKMRGLGLSDVVISETTGLSEEEIKKI